MARKRSAWQTEGGRERPRRVQHRNQPCLHTLGLSLGTVATNGRAKSRGKNNEMRLPSKRNHHAMPAFDLESVHEAFLAGIFKTKIEIFSSMIYKISLERWGRTQYNKEQNSTPLLITVLESMGQARQSHVRMFFVPSPEIRVGISYQFSRSELLKPRSIFGLFSAVIFFFPGVKTSRQVIRKLYMYFRD